MHSLGPDGNVQSLRSIGAAFNSITLTWDELSCLDHNGLLTGYVIEYGNTSFDNAEIVTGTSITVAELLPLTTYIFRVAAVNQNGTGTYSFPVSKTTLTSGKLTAGFVMLYFYTCVEVILWQSNLRVTNQSIVDSDEIVLGGNDLFCLTNFDMGQARMGSWYFPDGREVPNFPGTGFTQIRGSSYVALTYSSSGSSPTGLYHCEIPDMNGQNVTLFAGVGQGTMSH